MGQDWFYVQNGQQRGPVSFDVLQSMSATGQLQADELVWTQTMPQWQPASTIPGLISFSVPAPPTTALRPPPLTQRFDQPPIHPQQLGYAVPTPHQGSSMGDDPAVRWILPVGRSGWAIAAGYMGLLSTLFIFSPLAILFSILAFREMKRNPHRRGMGRAVFGLVMGVIFLVLGVVLLLKTSSRRF